MSYTEPVTKDDVFFYGPNGLYVEVADRGQYSRLRHSRDDPSHLYGLLTYVDQGPVLTKKGVPSKRQPPKHQDETGHFYCAQLLHYGLKPVKAKAAAKQRLLDAFGPERTLRVPDNIVQLEKELKILYDYVNAQGKIQYERGKRDGERAEAERRDALDLKKRQDTIVANVVAASRINTTANSKKRKSEPEAGPSKSKKTKGINLKFLDLSGSWEISCPRLAEEYDQASGRLTMKMATSRNSLEQGRSWTSFDFGVISGIMRAKAFPLPSNGTISFEWRGSESGEDQMTFGSGNKGTITFLGDGKLKGTISGDYIPDKSVPFFGTQNQDNLRHIIWLKYVRQWKETWRGINYNAYEAASQARWGNWVSSEGCMEGPADSDTTVAGGVSEDESSVEEEGYGW